MRTKARPLSTGISRRNFLNASRPPAEAPMPTTCTSFGTLRRATPFLSEVALGRGAAVATRFFDGLTLATDFFSLFFLLFFDLGDLFFAIGGPSHRVGGS